MLRHDTGVQHLADAISDLCYQLRIEMRCPKILFKRVVFADQLRTLCCKLIPVGGIQLIGFQIPDGLLKLLQFLFMRFGISGLRLIKPTLGLIVNRFQP